VNVIEARGLRKEFTVRVKAGVVRRDKRVVAAVDGVDLTVERGEMANALTNGGRDYAT
jgi:ABC-2 type transport system ATP-binding protein